MTASTEPEPINPTSALPAWLQEVLPGWFKTRPATTEALYAGLMSMGHATYIIGAGMYGVALGDGAATITQFWAWSLVHWQGYVLGYLFGTYIAGGNAKKAGVKAAAAANP